MEISYQGRFYGTELYGTDIQPNAPRLHDTAEVWGATGLGVLGPLAMKCVLHSAARVGELWRDWRLPHRGKPHRGREGKRLSREALSETAS